MNQSGFCCLWAAWITKANINAALADVKRPCPLTDPGARALRQGTEVPSSSMIYAAPTIAGPVAYGSVCIYILHLCLPFIFYLMKSGRKLVTWQKLAFSELRRCRLPDTWAGAVCVVLPSPGAVLLFLNIDPSSLLLRKARGAFSAAASCRSPWALQGGQEIPVTDGNVMSLCCPIAAGFLV